MSVCKGVQVYWESKLSRFSPSARKISKTVYLLLLLSNLNVRLPGPGTTQTYLPLTSYLGIHAHRHKIYHFKTAVKYIQVLLKNHYIALITIFDI